MLNFFIRFTVIFLKISSINIDGSLIILRIEVVHNEALHL